MQQWSSFVRTGLWTLPVAGVLWIIGSPLRGDLPDPTVNAPAFMTALAAPSYLWGVVINLVGLLLATLGFIALCGRLTEREPRPVAISGMVLMVLGQEMILSFYGIFVFVLPIISQLSAPGTSQADVALALFTSPGFVAIYLISGLAYMAGSVLFSVAMWKHPVLPKWVAVCFSLSALVLCAGPVFKVPIPVSNVLGALLLIASSGWIARRSR